MARVDTEDLKDRFKDFLTETHTAEIQAFADEYPNQLQFTFPWTSLEEFDPFLARKYRAHPTSAQKPIDQALQFSDAHDAICLRNTWAYPSTPPEEIHLHALRADHIGTLIGTSVRVTNVEETGVAVRVGGYRCQACENLETVYFPRGEPSEPYYCSDCGRKRTYFELEDEYTHFVQQRTATATDATHLLYDFEHPTSMNAEFLGPVAERVETGSWLQCIGVLSGDFDESGQLVQRLIIGYASRQTPKSIEEGASIDESLLNAPTTDTSHISAFTTVDIDLRREHLVGFVTHVQELVEEYKHRSEMTEEEVKIKIINPLLELLGWDIFGSEVKLEHPVVSHNSQKAVDYALVKDGEPVICVEAKNPSDPVARSALDQLYGYMRTLNAEWGILTNGWEYRLIRKGASGTPNQLAEFTIELIPDHIQLLENYTYTKNPKS